MSSMASDWSPRGAVGGCYNGATPLSAHHLHAHPMSAAMDGMNTATHPMVQPPLVGSLPYTMPCMSDPLMSQSYGMSAMDGMNVNSMLLNMNIPNGDFSRAVNFEALQTNGLMHGEEETSFMEEEGDISQSSLDGMEQQQAKEQARLLAQFKQLRDWQQQQQLRLVQQQQQQLAQLRLEQERVSQLIGRQRVTQWGQDASLLQPADPRPQMSSPKRHGSGGPASTIPAALAQGAMAQGRLGALAAARTPGGTSQVQMKDGRPVPIFPERPPTPEEYLDGGDPYLDSETNTNDSASHCGTDDFLAAELVDTGPRPIRKPMSSPSQAARLHFAGGDWPDQIRPPLAYNGLPNDLELSQHVGAYDRGHISQGNKNLSDTLEGRPLDKTDPVDSNQRQVLDFRETDSEVASESTEYGEYLRNSSMAEGCEPVRSPEQCGETRRGVGMSRDYLYGEETDEEVDQREYEEDVGMTGDDPLNLDEIPVAGGQKTFEQLLEEQLRLEEAGHQSAPSSAPTGPARRTFLRRGEGIARFNSAPPRTGKAKKSGVSSGMARGPAGKKTAPAKMGSTAATMPNKTTMLKRPAPSKQNQAAKPPTQKPEPAAKKLVTKKPTLTQANPVKTGPPSRNVTNGRQPPKGNGTRPPPTLKLQAPMRRASPVLRSNAKDMSDVESVGDVSFQRCMQERARNEVVEASELEDFEILEQFADDNVSFMSNVSAVDRRLRHEKFIKRGRAPSTQVSRQQTVEEDDTEDDAAELSEDCGKRSSETDSEEEEANRTLTETDRAAADPHAYKPQRKIAPFSSRSPIKAEKSKSPPIMSNSLAHLSRVMQFSSSEEDHLEFPLEGFPTSMKTKNVNNQQEPLDTNCNIMISNPKVVQDITLHTRDSDEEQNDPDSGAFNSEDSCMTEDESEAENGQKYDEFDDDVAWDEISRDDSDDPTTVQRTEYKKSAITISRVGGDGDSGGPVAPPTSQLVGKLFPKLKQDLAKQREAQQKQIQQEFEAARQTAQQQNHDSAQSQMLRDKLAELEKEIDKFRSENATLARLRKEREEGLLQMQKEVAEFEKQKADELQKIQDYKSEETKKLKREKKLFEQYTKTARSVPDRKERQEIETLKQQVSELQDEIKRKESRWTSSSNRLRVRIEQLETENGELKEEIKILERLRLEGWNKKDRKEEVEKRPTHSQRSPRPEPQMKKISAHAHPLRLSSNHELDATEETESEISEAPNIEMVCDSEPKKLKDSGIKTSETFSSSKKSPEPMPRGMDIPGGIPRKRAVPFSISNTVDKGNEEYEEVQHSDGKVEKLYSNGAREILFANGTRKQISADGQSIIVSFFNGDMKQILPDQRVVYYYADAQTTHTTYPDGLEILQFPNQQTEKHYPDGTKEISFPDHTIKYLFPNGTEESIFPDGTVIRLELSGQKVMEFPNGQREIHTPQYKRREYPDGTVKTVYPDGRQETRYSSGRIRVKDKDGQVIVDKRVQ